MTLKPFEFSEDFREDRCDRCGICFHRCPVLQLSLEEAQTEMDNLLRTGQSSVLEKCTGCMACNSFCPADANPHALILAKWNDRYHQQGIPARGRLVLPYQQPNLYTLVMQKLPQDEQALVSEWERNWKTPPTRECMMYAGCNALLQPFLLDSALFAGLPIFGSAAICCGEPLYRMGCREAAIAAAQHVRAEFERMGLRQVVMPCLAGYHLFKHVYPEVLGVPLDLEVISIVDWLLEKLDQGNMQVTPVERTCVMHDSCWPKASGDAFFDKTRALLVRLGMEVLEPAHTREEALCCGMCAAAARFSLLDIARTARQRLDEFEQTGADMTVDYCGGCNWLFYVAAALPPAKPIHPVYHLLEVVQMAIGESPKHRTQQRARQVMKTLALPLARTYLDPRRFQIENIMEQPVSRPGSI